MGRLRNILVQRICAALLIAGVALTLVPTAVALDARVAALGALLGDTDAVEAALEAADAAPNAESAADAFARRYVALADEALSQREIVELLLGEAFRHVAPVTPGAAFVSAPPTAPAPRVGGSGVGVLVSSEGLSGPTVIGLPAVASARRLANLVTESPKRSRAP